MPLMLLAANATQRVFVVPAVTPSGCLGNPTAPANAANFSCIAASQGSNCSTVCRAGYTLTSGNLTAVCSSGAAAVWSNVTGVCSPASELLAVVSDQHPHNHFTQHQGYRPLHNNMLYTICHDVCAHAVDFHSCAQESA
jgi:hypothetical protein